MKGHLKGQYEDSTASTKKSVGVVSALGCRGAAQPWVAVARHNPSKKKSSEVVPRRFGCVYPAKLEMRGGRNPRRNPQSVFRSGVGACMYHVILQHASVGAMVWTRVCMGN